MYLGFGLRPTAEAYSSAAVGLFVALGSYPGDFPPERVKINDIDTLLKGTAAADVHNGILKPSTNPTDPTKWPWKSGQKLL